MTVKTSAKIGGYRKYLIKMMKTYQGFIDNPLNDKSKAFAQKMLKHIGIDKVPEGFNFAINEGQAAGRTIEHFHLNIIPRYFGDMEGPQRGIKKIFPDFEYYKD